MAANGSVLIMGEAVGETLKENRNSIGHFMYNFSVLQCLLRMMGFLGAAGTGTVKSAFVLRSHAVEEVFKRMNVPPVGRVSFRSCRSTP